jgi:uncharacterized membrane protein
MSCARAIVIGTVVAIVAQWLSQTDVARESLPGWITSSAIWPLARVTEVVARRVDQSFTGFIAILLAQLIYAVLLGGSLGWLLWRALHAHASTTKQNGEPTAGENAG